MDSIAVLTALAKRRHTNRAPYLPQPVDSAMLAGLTLDGSVEVRHLQTQAERRRFSAFVARHAGQDFAHGAAWRETYSYIRWSDAQVARRRDGFTLAHLFGTLSPWGWWLRRVALAPATMAALRFVGYPRLLATQLAAVVRCSPAIVMMSLPQDEPSVSALLSAADRLADYWLHATEAGLVIHPISVVIQHEDLHAALQARFGLSGRTFFIARVGRSAASFPSSPRRPATAAFRDLS